MVPLQTHDTDDFNQIKAAAILHYSYNMYVCSYVATCEYFYGNKKSLLPYSYILTESYS